MKQKVIKVLANKDLNPKQKFNELLNLYREHRAHVPQTMRYLNSVGFSPINLKNLEYDIQKLYEIKDVEIADQRNASSATEDLKGPKVPQGVLEGSISDLKKYLSGETDKVVLSGLIGEELTGKNRVGAIKAIESRIDEIMSLENNDDSDSTEETETETDATTTEGETTTTEGDQDEVNYDTLSYQDLKKAAAKRAEETGEAPADQTKVTLLAYLKKKA